MIARSRSNALAQTYLFSRFLRRYAPALIAFHFFGTDSLQHPGRASTIVVGSGAAKKGMLYLAGVMSFAPPSLILGAFGLSKSSDACSFNEDGGSITRWIVFFHRPLLHLMSKYPTLTITVPGFGSTCRNFPLLSRPALVCVFAQFVSAISRPPTSSWKRSVRVPKSECAGIRVSFPERRREVDAAG